MEMYGHHDVGCTSEKRCVKLKLIIRRDYHVARSEVKELIWF
jgi:hypothetical protein